MKEAKLPSVKHLNLSFGFLLALYIFSLFVLFFQSNDLILHEPLMTPSWNHLFGTDSLGRDYFSRVMLGTQISYLIGALGALLTVSLGAAVGFIMAFAARYQSSIQRFIDIYQSLPSFALVTVFCLFFQNLLSDLGSLPRAGLTLIIAVGLSHWMNSARILSSKVIKTLSEPYVESSIALGARKLHLVRYHISPAFKEEFKILFVSLFPQVVVYESFMSFVGLGIPAPFTSWGSLIQESWTSLSVYPHLLFFPGLMLFITLYLLQIGLKPAAKKIF